MTFSDVFVDEVRRAADIVRVVGERVELKRLGTAWKGLCPFHREKTPSFQVRSEPPLFHCFGCGEGGDAFKFLMLYDKCSFPDAVEALARRFGVPVPEHRHDTGPERKAREQILAALEAAALHFTRSLWGPSGRPALEYLLGRGFRKTTLERIRAGAAGDSWDELARALGSNFPREVLLGAGLLVPSKDGRAPYDRFRQRAVFPILNETGQVVAFGARSLDGSEPKYLNSPETPVYQKSRTLYGLSWAKDGIRRAGCIILMEGYLDVARAIEAGVDEAVATCGTALTQSHARLLRRYAERVVLNFDQDEAGQAAARRSFEALTGEGLQIHVVELPPGHDPDTYLKEFGAEAYRARLAEAPPFVEWLVRRAGARHDTHAPLGQAAFAADLLPVLARVDNAVERAAWAQRVAEAGGLDRAALDTELARALQPAAARPPQPALPALVGQRRNGLLPAEQWLLSMIARGEEGIDEALENLDEADVAGRPSAELWLALLAQMRRGAGVDLAALAGQLEDEALRSRVTRLAVEPLPTGDATPDGCVREMKCWPLEARVGEIRRTLAENPAADVNVLLQEQIELKQRIAALARPAAEPPSAAVMP